MQARPLTRRLLCRTASLAPFTAAARADNVLRVSVADFYDGISTPALVEALSIAFAKLPGVQASFTTLPFARSMASVAAGESDLHVPMIRPATMAGLSWAISAATVYHVPFVLYSNADSLLDVNDLGRYRIETDVAHVGYFGFPVTGGAGIESSLRKVAAGRIDGYIYAGNIVDPLIETLHLTNIRRRFYKVFDAAGVLPKDGNGGRADQLLTAAMTAAAGDPGFDAAIATLLSGYRAV